MHLKHITIIKTNNIYFMQRYILQADDNLNKGQLGQYIKITLSHNKTKADWKFQPTSSPDSTKKESSPTLAVNYKVVAH